MIANDTTKLSTSRPLLTALLDTARLVWIHITQQRLPIAVAVAIGIGIAIVTRNDIRWSMALVATVTFSYSAAFVLGLRLLRESDQRSFYYSLPVRSAALWWGGLMGGIATSWLLGLIILAPNWLLLGRGYRLDTSFVPWLFIGVPAAFLLPHAVVSLAAARTRWRFLNIAPLAVLGGCLFLAGYRIYAVNPASNALVAVVTVTAVAIHLGILVGAHLRASKARLDSARGHHLFAGALWTFVAVGAAVTLWIAQTVTSPPLDQLTYGYSELSHDGPWQVVAATDESDAVTRWLRDNISYWYAVNEKSGVVRQMHNVDHSHLTKTNPPLFNATSIASAAEHVFWIDHVPGDTSYLKRLDLRSGQVAEMAYPFELLDPVRWWASPNGQFLVGYGPIWTRPVKPPQQQLGVHVVDLESGQIVARYSVPNTQTRIIHMDRFSTQLASADIELSWTSHDTASIQGFSQGGVFFDLDLDLARRALSVKTELRIDPDQLHKVHRSSYYLVGGVEWQSDLNELWLTDWQNLLAFSKSNGGTITSRVVVSTDSGALHGFHRTQDTLVTIKRSLRTTPMREDTPGVLKLHRLTQEGTWHELPDAGLPFVAGSAAQLSVDSFALIERGWRRSDAREADSILELSNDTARITQASDWLTARGLPTSPFITLTSDPSLIRLTDGSFWRIDPTASAPEQVHLPIS